MSIFKKVTHPTKSDEKKTRAAEGDVVAKLNLFEENYEQLYEQQIKKFEEAQQEELREKFSEYDGFADSLLSGDLDEIKERINDFEVADKTKICQIFDDLFEDGAPWSW